MLMALMKTSLIQRIHKTQTSDVVHSSGYAKVQRNNGGGPHSGMSFSARSHVDQNRTYVKGYGSSMVMQQGNKMPAATSVEMSGAEAEIPTPLSVPHGQQEHHFGWTSSRDTVASWGYKNDVDINAVANTTTADNTNDSSWGYGRKSGDRESLQAGYGRTRGDREALHKGYGRAIGGRESLHKGYGRMTTADAAGKQTGYANAAAQRQARAARFSGSTGRVSGSAPRPTIGPTFGRHA